MSDARADSRTTPGPAPRYWDLVMKGGITSGIVYPRAVCELAREFTFRNIGGTSAGAIAAAVTAAAELGRQHGLDSFRKLEDLPRQLGRTAPNGKASFLFSLFQPQKPFVRIYRVLTSLIGADRPFLTLCLRLPRAYWPWTLLSVAVGAAFWFTLMPGASGLLILPRVVAAVLLALLTLVVTVGFSIRRELGRMSAHHLGFCTGMPNPDLDSEALTPWLTDLFNEYAGKPAEEPLTFGDLWGTSDRAGERLINLQMMTTSLTHGRPYRLPFDQNIFFFREEEFRNFFPDEVVDWMVAHPRTASGGYDGYDGFRPLPSAADLPVIVATRMSLSFPVLFCAVPLYAVDYSRPRADQRPEPCWFSDGGICSNFPVHFFDAPLPRWPTFAINLMDWDPTREGRCNDGSADMVYLPESNKGGILELWNRFELDRDGRHKQGLGPLKGMVGAIVRSMQNWVDNRQMRIPGYRDRIAHVTLCPEEGGMNLGMPASVIQSVSDRGADAGRRLADRFRPGSTHPMNWDNHRWVRFRSTMAAVEELLEKVVRGYTDAETAKPFRSYEQLLNRDSDEEPDSYRYRETQRESANLAISKVLELAAAWSDAASLSDGAPKPEPELRIMPRVVTKAREVEKEEEE